MSIVGPTINHFADKYCTKIKCAEIKGHCIVYFHILCLLTVLTEIKPMQKEVMIFYFTKYLQKAIVQITVTKQIQFLWCLVRGGGAI